MYSKDLKAYVCSHKCVCVCEWNVGVQMYIQYILTGIFPKEKVFEKFHSVTLIY